jgi:hypothetical protein
LLVRQSTLLDVNRRCGLFGSIWNGLMNWPHIRRRDTRGGAGKARSVVVDLRTLTNVFSRRGRWPLAGVWIDRGPTAVSAEDLAPLVGALRASCRARCRCPACPRNNGSHRVDGAVVVLGDAVAVVEAGPGQADRLVKAQIECRDSMAWTSCRPRPGASRLCRCRRRRWRRRSVAGAVVVGIENDAVLVAWTNPDRRPP